MSSGPSGVGESHASQPTPPPNPALGRPPGAIGAQALTLAGSHQRLVAMLSRQRRGDLIDRPHADADPGQIRGAERGRLGISGTLTGTPRMSAWNCISHRWRSRRRRRAARSAGSPPAASIARTASTVW